MEIKKEQAEKLAKAYVSAKRSLEHRIHLGLEMICKRIAEAKEGEVLTTEQLRKEGYDEYWINVLERGFRQLNKQNPPVI